MKTKNVTYLIALVTFLFIVVGASYAQEEKEVQKPVVKTNNTVSDSTMSKDCMNKVASDDDSPMMMKQKMKKSAESDDEAMKEKCKTMMDNPEMQSMMKEMMEKMDGKMMQDGMMKDKSNSNDEGGSESTHEAHHKDDNKGDG